MTSLLLSEGEGMDVNAETDVEKWLFPQEFYFCFTCFCYKRMNYKVNFQFVFWIYLKLGFFRVQWHVG